MLQPNIQEEFVEYDWPAKILWDGLFKFSAAPGAEWRCWGCWCLGGSRPAEQHLLPATATAPAARTTCASVHMRKFHKYGHSHNSSRYQVTRHYLRNSKQNKAKIYNETNIHVLYCTVQCLSEHKKISPSLPENKINVDTVQEGQRQTKRQRSSLLFGGKNLVNSLQRQLFCQRPFWKIG